MCTWQLLWYVCIDDGARQRLACLLVRPDEQTEKLRARKVWAWMLCAGIDGGARQRLARFPVRPAVMHKRP